MKRFVIGGFLLGVAACGGSGGGYYNPYYEEDLAEEVVDDGGMPAQKPDLARPTGKADLATTAKQDLAMQEEPADLAMPKPDLAVAKADLAMGMNPAKGEVGDPCMLDGDCKGMGARCIKDAQGWPGGYCAIMGCAMGTCPNGSDCYQLQNGGTICLKTCNLKADCRQQYACESYKACVPGCTGNADCDPGEVCDMAELVCKKAPCTMNSCGQGMKCVNGQCVPDVMGGPGPGPGPTCNNLPPRDCVGDNTYCGQLVYFDPRVGPGYDDYPINGETAQNQYRSFARRDLMMLIKYAAAYVDCKSKNWNWGNVGLPLGLGDMSEKNGAIPGTSIGQPGHPQGTHVNGYDMDIAYHQMKGPNNYLREICPHTINGKEQYHCTAAPDNFDLWRTTLFIGALFSSGRVRVLGVDGQVGPLVEKSMPTLCAQGWLPQVSCQKIGKLAFETTDQGRGWYLFHLHHMHISLHNALGMSKEFDGEQCHAPGCWQIGPKLQWVPGHQFVQNPIDLKL